MSLLKKFYSDPYMQPRSMALSMLLGVTLSAAAYSFHSQDFYRLHFAWWHPALVFLGIYAGGISTIFIHNATHNSFPWRWLNECCGYLSGIHQLWGFKGWQLMHLMHHQYADNDDMDPHKHTDVTFWQFARILPMRANAKIRERYFEHWGDTRRTRLLLSPWFLGPLSSVLVVSNLLLWYALLGPVGFIFFYLPSNLTNYMLVTDVNYTAHPTDPVTGKTYPVNLDTKWWHRIGNILWCGVYYHANHHRRPMLFNPQKMPEHAVRQQRVEIEMAA